MGPKGNFSEKRRSFAVFLLISMILVVLIIVGFFAVNDYLFTRVISKRNLIYCRSRPRKT